MVLNEREDRRIQAQKDGEQNTAYPKMREGQVTESRGRVALRLREVWEENGLWGISRAL